MIGFTIIFMFGEKAKNLKRIFILGLIGISIILIRPGIYQSIERLYNATFDKSTIKGSSFRWRAQVAELAFSQINSSDNLLNLLFGYGQGSHLFMEFPTTTTSTGQRAEFLSWDNEFAVLFYEHGYMGFLLTIVFFLILSIKTYRLLHYTQFQKKIVPLSFLSCISIIIFLQTNVKIFAPQLVFIEMIILASSNKFKYIIE